MTIRHTIWKVGEKPEPLSASSLGSEQQLEDMIVAAPEILSDEWMLIGRQENTGFRGRIDLLAIAPDGALVIIEIKRDRTPREVVAQAIDYACWVEKLEAEDIAGIYSRFSPGRRLEEDFQQKFGQPLDEDTLNESHQIIVVAGSLDESSERIVAYLGERGIAINVLCFQIFNQGTEQLLSRAWLLDPIQTQASGTSKADGPKEPWNGEFYVSFGAGKSRSWSEAAEYGFISAGGGSWYSKTLQLLRPGDRIWVNAPGSGYVGVGQVAGRPEPARDYQVRVKEGEMPALEILKNGDYHRDFVDDLERCEYFVPIYWLQTVQLENGVSELGLFGNQNTVCKPTTPKWRHTVERLREHFPEFDK